MDERFVAITSGRLQICTPASLQLSYRAPQTGFQTGGNLWIFYDIRQFQHKQQTFLPENGIPTEAPASTSWKAQPLVDGGVIRTFDTHPEAPEFLHAIHIQNTKGMLSANETITIQPHTHTDGFMLPHNAINAFHFWLVEDPTGELTFYTDGGKYHFFLPRKANLSILKSNPISILPAPPETLRMTTRSGKPETVDVLITALDTHGNPVDLPDPITVRSSADAVSTSTTPPTTRITLRTSENIETITAESNTLNAQSNAIQTNSTTDLHLYWGDIHGMMFNQRPVADYFAWAKDIAHLDFSGGQYFSYTACIADVWEHLLTAWRTFDLPGQFISLPSVEYGTPPDGGHRLAFFPHPDNHPPIFCEDRPEAHDSKLHAKFHPQTIYCKDQREFYETVHKQGGFTQGHFHTFFYEGEHVAEIYQKQHVNPDFEEAKINRAIQFQKLKLGIVSGSDTHDSRPANPYPECGPSNPAGLTGIWAQSLDRDSIFDAFFHRRCYATTGTRIAIDFRVNNEPMGSTVCTLHPTFTADILGTGQIDRIELIHNGRIAQTFKTEKQHIQIDGTIELPFSPTNMHYVYLRIFQQDGHRAWTSPIWIEPVP